MAELDLPPHPSIEKTLQLEVPLLIPGLTDRQDGCLDRLEAALAGRSGISCAHVQREQDPPLLCLHYDPSHLSSTELQQMAERAGAEITSRYRHEIFLVEGMDCSDCALVISHSLARMPGILDARASFAAQTLQVEYDTHQTSRLAIRRRLTHLGYRVPLAGVSRWLADNTELIFSLLAGMSLTLGWLVELVTGWSSAISLGFYLAAYVWGGWHVALHSWRALRQRRFDVDLLMLSAALGAAALGQFAEGALLLFLFSLGHALEERALERARSSIRALGQLSPRHALVQRGDQEILQPVEEIAIGDLVVVRPGERFPVDGTVIAGQSAVNQAPITGESLPVDKLPGDLVYAGSVNGQGAMRVRVSRLARDSTLARVTHMVEQAQAQKSPTQQITERFMAWFVPAVLLIDLLLIVIPPLFGVPFSTSFLRAMTFLVAASPCALALGTPSAILAGIARAARGGVLVKGGLHLENLGRLDALAFDKTGTLTHGRLSVTDVIPDPATGRLPDELLALAAAVEKHSAHPLARAVVREAEERRLALPEASAVQAVDGRGVQAQIQGALTWAGSPRWFEESGWHLSPALSDLVNRMEQDGKTTILVRQEAGFAGLIAMADSVRPEARAAISGLREKGIKRILILSGDSERIAARVADQVGIDEYRAQLLPQDKLAAIHELVKNHQAVAMVGDGVNDAPALANATVGVAMGGASSDTALETADVALMSSNLERLPFAVGLGGATRRVIRQNLAVALGVIVTLSLASIIGWAGIGAAILFHEGSTLLVVLNSLRLLSFREA
jgi:Cd2+/Zn2+-exporting ATPase